MKQDCNIADGVLRGVVRRLYQGAFFFFKMSLKLLLRSLFSAPILRKLTSSDHSYDFHQNGTTVKQSG